MWQRAWSDGKRAWSDGKIKAFNVEKFQTAFLCK